VKARYEWPEAPEDTEGVIRSCRQRGWSWEAIVRILNAAGKRWPPPTGAAKWTGYLVRTTLKNARTGA